MSNPSDQTPLLHHASAKKKKRPCSKWNPFKKYAALKVVGVFLAAYIAVMTFSPLGALGQFGGFVSLNGLIIDPESHERTEDGLVLWKGTLRPIIADSTLQMICLGISRCSAFFLYPSLVLVFTTKFRATMELIAQSPFGMFTYDDLHELHVFCGWMCVFDGAVHTALHTLRWNLQDNIHLLWTTRSGISGIICILCIWIISLPMGWEIIRSRVGYEARKCIHYFFVVFCITMAFHAPISTIPNGGFAPIIFPTLILWWTLDSLYVYLFMSEKIKTSMFHVLPTGMQLTMTVSKRFQSVAADGGYCYINLPWVSKMQWHAFSLFENPANPNERQVFMMKVGDWTADVLEALQRDTHRPVWICGPFSSPYDNAAESDNQILVAGGIGITPAISVMRKHQESRRSNLIWACRDPHMLEFFVKHAEFSKRGWNMIFYTGKQPLYIGDTSEIVTSNGALVHIIRSRPDLPNLIPNIIYSIESGKYMPEELIPEVKVEAITQLQEKLEELHGLNLTSQQKMTELINYSNNLGFLFTDLMQEIVSDKNESGRSFQQSIIGEVKKEERRTQMLDNIQQYKSTHVKFADSCPNFDRAISTNEATGLRSRSTMTWKAVESGVDTWLEDFIAYKPWNEDSLEAKEYVNGLDRERVLGTWGALYCGGQGPLASNLKKAAKDFGIHLAMESFKW